jgi:uncharacterized protein (TIGR00255 family)
MILSMTGYAQASRETPHGSLHLELKSVNGRFLDVQFRIGEDLRMLEPQFRELIGTRVSRGKVDCRLSYSLNAAARADAGVNGEALARLARLVAEARAVMPDLQPMRVSEALAWPGVLGDNAGAFDALRAASLELMQTALGEFVASRAREGAKLADMIRTRTAFMRERIRAVEPLIPEAIAGYQEKLAARLREALAGGDEERIRQEVAVFGVKIDVAEEFSRLGAHLDEVDRVLKAGGQVGKRLDFLMQELNREANTLGSKSVSKEVSDAVIELKLAIEQMREQVQNLE